MLSNNYFDFDIKVVTTSQLRFSIMVLEDFSKKEIVTKKASERVSTKILKMTSRQKIYFHKRGCATHHLAMP